MENILKLVGVILFLALASVSLAIRFRLTKHEDNIMKDKKDSKSVMAKIIRNSFMIK
jgi:hypothetical protein